MKDNKLLDDLVKNVKPKDLEAVINILRIHNGLEPIKISGGEPQEELEFDGGIAAELTVREAEVIKDHLIAKGLPTDRNVAFGDVAIPERYSTIRSRSEIQDFHTQLAPGLAINVPLISANMACVTGPELVVALQSEGGLGIIPQMLPLQERLAMLDEIRRAKCALIDDPLTIAPNRTLREAKTLMDKFGIYSLVVVDERKRPVGILSTRDWRYETDETKLVSQLMGGNGNKLKTAPKGTSFDEAAKILRKHRIEKLPLVNRNDKLAGLITANGLFYEHYYPRATRDDKYGRFLLVGSVGVGEKVTRERLYEVEAQIAKGIDLLLIDTARASSINTKEMILAVKKKWPKLKLMVGNVSAPENVKFLCELGVDIIKVGIGPGDACRTREIGIGLPQLSAVAKAAAIAGLYGKTVVADGGFKNPGDIVRALIAGASACMSGTMFIVTEESAAPAQYDDHGLKIKIYEGSASFPAQQRRMSSRTLKYARRPEGIAKPYPVTCTAQEKVADTMDGLRSAMSYIGAHNIKELQSRGRFELQTPAGLKEGIKK